VRAVFDKLPKGLAGDEEAIHQMRVAGRRLRVALPLLARRPEGKRVRRALKILRQLTRAAGQSRDLDVGLDLLERHLDEAGPSALTAGQKRVRQRLRSARTRSRRQMAEALMDLEIAQLRRDLRATLGRRADDLFTVLGRIRTEREERGQRLQAGFAALAETYDPDALHALRRQARRLRYVAEVHDALLRNEPSDAAPLFKTLQERIGALHDVHVLARWLETRARAGDAPSRPGEAEAAAQLWAVFDARGRELHRSLLEARPAETVARGLLALSRGRTAA
jgi:CHAD domain-containing protein